MKVDGAVLRWMLFAGTVAASTLFGWWEIKAQGADWMPVRYVRVEGAFQYIAKDTVKQVLARHVMHGFFNTDLQQIHASVTALPWADRVEVQRIWPDALKISITEQRPVARWGGRSLLNNEGDLFVPENLDEFAQLPLITGPEGQQRKLLELMKGLKVALRDQAMALSEFAVNERRAWKVVLASGLEIKLGRKTQLENLNRFLRTVELLGREQVAMMAAVDLRYPNGYAVTWKEDADQIDWEKVMSKKPDRA